MPAAVHANKVIARWEKVWVKEGPGRSEANPGLSVDVEYVFRSKIG